MPSGSPSHAERARTAANARWAKEPDLLKATAPGLKAMMEHFENQVDPERKLSAKERRKRAENARKEHLSRIRLNALRAARLQRDRESEASAEDQAT